MVFCRVKDNIAYNGKINTLRISCDIFVVNVRTNKTYIYSSLKDACHHLKLDLVRVKNKRIRSKRNSVIDGYIFMVLNEYKDYKNAALRE